VSTRLHVRNVAYPKRPLSLEGGPTIAHGDTARVPDHPAIQAQIDDGHLLIVDEPAAPASPAAKTTGKKR
jgi:hypothetical protein